MRCLVAFFGAISMSAAAAAATTTSYQGTLAAPSDIAFEDFELTTHAHVFLRSWSYAGGINAEGSTIARGGFRPVLTLFSFPTGINVGFNGGGGCGNVAADAVSGQCWDATFDAAVGPGSYRAVIQVYPNIAGSFFGIFSGASSFDDPSGVIDNPRNGAWAFDITTSEIGGPIDPVPEPKSWAMLIAGFGLTGAAIRRRRRVITA